ncbi:MAG TPA: peptide chain release factor 1 [Acholeplasma sp.]|jgi:peptide chain release factor 1|nr:peptide chain release factor 1 [Acholeplasma sp.]
MLERLQIIEDRYEEICNLLMMPEIAIDLKKVKDLSKEQKRLETIVTKSRSYRSLLEEEKSLESLINGNDLEIAELAKLEIEGVKEEILKVEEELKILLIPQDPQDDKNIICEIRGAAGGDEANIFAGDLFRMYSKYAEEKGWTIEVINSEPSDAGGFSKIEFMINGDSVYSFLKYESGAHRVQRVPETEASGRIHTSTATVLVMPEVDEVEVDLDLNDVRVDTYRSGGAGGQHVNKTESAIRLTHMPTGIVVQCQDGRSQHENKATAFKLLAARLYEHALQEQEQQVGKERLAKIGTGDRSEKIRTYNYPQNRVTDHRINFTIQQLDRVMNGKLDPIIEALITENQRRQLSKKEV